MELSIQLIGKKSGQSLFESSDSSDLLDDTFDEVEDYRLVVEELENAKKSLPNTELFAIIEQQPLVASIVSALRELYPSHDEPFYYFEGMGLLKSLCNEYIRLYYERFSIVEGKILSAVPLSAVQHSQLEVLFAKSMDCTKARMVNEIHPEIIGGVILESNDKQIDMSVRRQLKSMKAVIQK